MSTFILIHGAWHGGWCWASIKSLLSQYGHKVLTPDLPGAGSDFTPIKDIDLPLYVESIAALINSQSENVVLVGHSMGGIILSAVAEKIPNKIDVLVYLCAFMLKNDQCLYDVRKDEQNSLIELEFSEDQLSLMIKDKIVDWALYGCCSQENIASAKLLLRPQASIIPETKVLLTEERYGTIPRIYIECTDDKAISIGLQRIMIAEQPVAQVYSLDTDHSPFFSKPEELSSVLNEITRKFIRN